MSYIQDSSVATEPSTILPLHGENTAMKEETAIIAIEVEDNNY